MKTEGQQTMLIVKSLRKKKPSEQRRKKGTEKRSDNERENRKQKVKKFKKYGRKPPKNS